MSSRDSGIGTSNTATNSVPLGDTVRGDTLPLGSGGIVPPSPTILPGASTPAATRPQRPAQPVKVPVTLSAPESAALFVNGERVGHGSWSGDLAPSARTVFRATISDPSQSECRTASREEARRVSAGQSLDIDLDVRSCTGVQLNVAPANAIVKFEPLDGGQRWEGRADVTPTFSIPVGRYRVTATSPRCTEYEAEQRVQRQVSGGPWVLRVLLICP